MSEPTFDWIGLGEGADDQDAYVSITRARNGYWEIVTDGLDGFDNGPVLDDDAASAWSTVAYIMTEHGATDEETGEMVQHAPANLGWGFDGQVGMFAYDEDEEWDG